MRTRVNYYNQILSEFDIKNLKSENLRFFGADDRICLLNFSSILRVATIVDGAPNTSENPCVLRIADCYNLQSSNQRKKLGFAGLYFSGAPCENKLEPH